jgi:hypothetical protein
MENKTALQELMDWMIEQSQVIPVDPGDVYRKAEELLVKEQEQIINAWISNRPQFKNEAEQYYNETYGKQDIS